MLSVVALGKDNRPRPDDRASPPLGALDSYFDYSLRPTEGEDGGKRPVRG
jgi:hypothetical protein